MIPHASRRLSNGRHLRAAIFLALAVALAAATPLARPTSIAPALQLGAPETIADGVDLFRTTDRTVADDASPISMLLLRLNPAAADLRVARAVARTPRREPVADIARRHRAIAAVNAGFFNMKTGAPTGVLKVNGALIRCASLPRAALAIERGESLSGPRLLVDRVRCANKRLRPLTSDVRRWARAPDIVGGAGLLAQAGRYIDDWTIEKFGAGFAGQRHPRTMAGTDAGGKIWLVVVDGRQPEHSVGMTLVELVALARRLGLRDAINLDGGGSTTMVVRGDVVNRPSDPEGARPVSDALVVVSR